MARGLLSGLCVVELASGLAAAYCGKLLADAGAEVIAVEPPGGSRLRTLPPFAHDAPGADRGLPFIYTSHGKRFETLALEAPAGRERLLNLLATADALVEDAAPGSLAAAGIDDAAVRAARERARGAGSAGRAAAPPKPVRGLVWTSLSPFGQTGPYHDWPASSITVQALSGWLGLVGEREREPLQTGGNLPDLAFGLPAAAATLAGLIGTRPDGAIRRFDLSQFEAMLTWQPPFGLGYCYRGGPPVRRYGNRLLSTHPFTILPCNGGREFVGVIHLTHVQWEMLCQMMGAEHLLDDPRLQTNAGRVANADLVDAALMPWLMERTAAECFHTAQTWRIPFALVPEADAIIASPQHAARGWLVEREHPGAGRYLAPGPLVGDRVPVTGDSEGGGHRAKGVGRGLVGAVRERPVATLPRSAAPWTVEDRAASTAAPSGDHHASLPDDQDQSTPSAPTPYALRRTPSPSLPLAGVRVLDLSAYWAGPIVGRFMADLGAEVIKVESVQRIDGWRGSFAPGSADRAYEFSPAHNHINVNKRGITLNLRSPAGVALCKRLAAVSDVVIENFSPRVMAQFGLDYPVLHALNPRLVMLSLSGFGASGPYRDYVSYALTVECMSGVPASTGYAGGGPMQQGGSIGDPLGGLNGAVATLMALWRAWRRRTGEGCWLDISQVEGVSALLGDWLLEYTIDGRVPARRGNAHPLFCPHGVYPCGGRRAEGEGHGDEAGNGARPAAQPSAAIGSGARDAIAAPGDEWIAIAVENEAQWRALCGAIGRPELAEDARFATLAARRANVAALDPIIAEWTRGRDKHAAQAALIAAGVPAGALQNNIETLSDPQLLARGFWQELEREYVGRHPHGGSGVLVDGAAPPLLRPAPTLGQHTADVLRELLGLSDAELAALEAEQVIGTRALP